MIKRHPHSSCSDQPDNQQRPTTRFHSSTSLLPSTHRCSLPHSKPFISTPLYYAHLTDTYFHNLPHPLSLSSQRSTCFLRLQSTRRQPPRHSTHRSRLSRPPQPSRTPGTASHVSTRLHSFLNTSIKSPQLQTSQHSSPAPVLLLPKATERKYHPHHRPSLKHSTARGGRDKTNRKICSTAITASPSTPSVRSLICLPQ